MMIRRTQSGLIICIFAFAFAPVPTNAQAGSEPTEEYRPYTVNPGDILSIVVWKEPDLSHGVIILPDGRFSFPLVGNVQAEGKSVEEIADIMKERLTRYVPDPVVTVAADQILGNDVYVLGQVLRPGKFVLSSRIDVTQALSLAGGTTPFAQVGDIKILRRINGKLIAIPFDYGDIEKGKRLHQNIILEPSDVVLVP